MKREMVFSLGQAQLETFKPLIGDEIAYIQEMHNLTHDDERWEEGKAKSDAYRKAREQADALGSIIVRPLLRDLPKDIKSAIIKVEYETKE